MRPLFLALTATTISSLSSFAGDVPSGRPLCEANAKFKAIDIHQPLHKMHTQDGTSAAKAVADFGVETVIRYYDWVDESIPCKTLTPGEADALLAAKLSVAVVFQHNNDDPETFIDRERGGIDAKRALELARGVGQPRGTAIYFGVDGVDQAIESAVWEYSISRGREIGPERRKKLKEILGARLSRYMKFYDRFREYRERTFRKPADKITGEDMLPFVDTYFRAIHDVFDKEAKPYEIAAYGSGLVCRDLLKKNLVKRCWLAQSTGWPGTKDFAQTSEWALLQMLPTSCPDWTDHNGKRDSVSFDFNYVNPKSSDFGQWSRIEKRGEPAAPSRNCKLTP